MNARELATEDNGRTSPVHPFPRFPGCTSPAPPFTRSPAAFRVVLERHGAVEHERARARVGIHTEISEALELVAGAGRRVGHARLDLAVADELERRRVDVLDIIAG